MSWVANFAIIAVAVTGILLLASGVGSLTMWLSKRIGDGPALVLVLGAVVVVGGAIGASLTT